MVLFVTGVCRFRCFYCPVSTGATRSTSCTRTSGGSTRDARCDRGGEVDRCRRNGITGGDPLGVVDRVEHYVRLLKTEFGPSHNIHLYTHEPNPAKLGAARPGRASTSSGSTSPTTSGVRSLGAGRRVPCGPRGGPGLGDPPRGRDPRSSPRRRRSFVRLLRALDEIGVDFVNLNELEFSETNEENLLGRGYRPDARNGWGVRGSRAVAERIVRESRLSVPVHYCSSRFKDGVQLRQRLLRQAERMAPAFADPTRTGRWCSGSSSRPTEGTWSAGPSGSPEGRGRAGPLPRRPGPSTDGAVGGRPATGRGSIALARLRGRGVPDLRRARGRARAAQRGRPARLGVVVGGS